jgi:hypothetical protein
MILTTRSVSLSGIVGLVVVMTMPASKHADAGAIAFANLNITNSQFRDNTGGVVGAQLVQGTDVQINSLNITTTNVAFHDQLGVDFNTDPVFGVGNVGSESDALQACVGDCPAENDFSQGNPLTDAPRVRGDSLATGNSPTTASVIDLLSNGTGAGNEDVFNSSTVAEALLNGTSNGNASGTIQGNSTVTGIFMGQGTRDVLFTGTADFSVYTELHPDALSGNAQANVNLNLRISNSSTGSVIIDTNVVAAQAGTGIIGIDATSGGPSQFAIPITVPLGVPLNVSLTQQSTVSVDVSKIPEPSTAALAGLGATLALGYIARRRAA